ncbi:GINS complex subunit 1 [Pancytospora epiphaga]|nr:GINS complex subunit 1 [Pancytospora epiphaga]
MLSEDVGRELLEEMRQKQIQQYNSQRVGHLEAEIEHVNSKLEFLKRKAASSEVSESLSVNFAILKAYKDRNMRILRAYRFYRMGKIQENYFAKKDIKRLLCTDEQGFENIYNEIIDEYLDDYRHLDFRSREPPLDYYVQIVTLENCGLIMSGNSFIDLKKGRLYFLKMKDIAHLIDNKLVMIT